MVWVPQVDVKEALAKVIFNEPLSRKGRWVVDHLPIAIMSIVWNDRNRKISQHKVKYIHAIVIEIHAIV